MRFDGEIAVSHIIGGIEDPIVSAGAKAGRHQTPASLLQYLSSLNSIQPPPKSVIEVRDQPKGQNPPVAQPSQNKLKWRKKEGNQSSFSTTQGNQPSSSTTPSNAEKMTCFRCKKQGHHSGQCSLTRFNGTCYYCQHVGHKEQDCRKKRRDGDSGKSVQQLGVPTKTQNSKYYKTVFLCNQSLQAFVDFGSTCTTLTESAVKSLQLGFDPSKRVVLTGYGSGHVSSLGTTAPFQLTVDEVTAEISAVVVPDSVQDTPVLLGQNFTELPEVVVNKTAWSLQFSSLKPVSQRKVELRATRDVHLPGTYLTHVPVSCAAYEGDLAVDASHRQGHCIPNTVLRVGQGMCPVLPVWNMSTRELVVREGQLLARGWPCMEDVSDVGEVLLDLPRIEAGMVDIGDVSPDVKEQLLNLINQYRDCFALSTAELGCAQSGQISIKLQEEKPFSYRP